MADSARPVLVISGISDGLGASVAKTFAAAGYDVVGLSRSERTLPMGGSSVYTHCRCDITEPAQVTAALQPYSKRIAVFVHNAHTLLIKPFEQTSLAEFEQVWRVACYGAATVAQFVLPSMLERGEGTIILTGATASIRGGSKFGAFSSAKFALRGLAQSLAREYGPRNIHVVHAILDGLIDGPQSNQRFGATESVRIEPEAIAEAYLGVAAQPRSAWTHEFDLRPFCERF